MNKIEVSQHLLRAAENIEQLQIANKSMGERLELVYAMLDHAKGSPREQKPVGYAECEVTRLVKAAEQLRKEADQEREFEPKVSEDVRGLGANKFASEISEMARQVSAAAINMECAPSGATRNAFVKVFFQRADELAKRLQKAGLGGPGCVT